MSKHFRNENKEMYRNYKYWNHQTQAEDKQLKINTLKEIKPSTTGQSTRNNKKGLKHIEEKIFIEFIAVNNIII